MGLKRYAILNDIHFPFEDKTRYAVALKIIARTRPDHLYLNGDIGEFIGFSHWPKHPGEHISAMAEIAYINKRFDELQELFPGIKATLVEGNHCNRFFRYIQNIAPAMWGLVDIPTLFRFEERGWAWIPYGPSQLVKCGVSNLYLRHEPLGGGANPAKMTAEASYIDIAVGHVHRFQTYSHKKVGPIPITNTAYCLGWLGDKSRSVFDYRGGKDSWVTGCTIVEADELTGQYTLEFVSLDKLPVLYRGEMFDAKVEG